MLLDCITAFAEAGLEVGMGENETLHIKDDSITWSASIIFVRTMPELGGHDARGSTVPLGSSNNTARCVDTAVILKMASLGAEDESLQDHD